MALAGNAGGAGGAKNTKRATRKRKPPSPGPPNFPTAVPSRPGAVTGPKPTRGHGPPPPPKPTLGTIPKLERAPGARQQRAAQKRAARARPAPVLPQVPIIRNPTQKQIVAAKTAIAAGLSRESKARGQDPITTLRQLAADPRTRHFARAASHYTRADERATAARLGRSVPVAPPQPVNPLGDLAAMGFEVAPNLSKRSRDIRVGRGLTVAQQQRNRFGPAPKPSVVTLGPTSLPIGAIAKGASRAIAGATSLDTGDIGPRSAFKKVAADVGTLGTAPFIAGYELGAGATDVLRGKGTGRLQRLGTGLAKGVAEEVRHPLKYAGEHPLLAAVDVAAGAGVAGRLAGATARTVGSTAEAGGVRGALARAGSTVRPPLALGSDANAPLFRRDYSKDLGRKAAQVAEDRAREPVRDAQGKVVTVRDRGRDVPVLQARPGERERKLKGEANFQAARANALERRVRDKVNHEFRAKGIKGRRARDLVSMVVEGTITSARHFETDLRQHRARIAAAIDRGDFRHTGELASAKARLKLVDDALASPRVMRQAERIVSTGEDIGRRLNEMESEAVRLGILHPKRAARSRLIVPAVEHLQARHFTPEELRALPPEELAQASGKALEHGALRRSDGTFLSNAEIEDALRAKGREPGTVAYLPHRFDVRGARAFHTQFRPGTRPTIDKPGVRTGSAYARGTTEASHELIREQAARLATQTTKAGSLDRLVSDYGSLRPDGKHYTAKEALETAQRLEHDTGERYVAMRAFPAKAGKQMEERARAQQTPGAMETLQQKLFKQRTITRDTKAAKRNVVLVPAPLVEQLEKHLRPAGTTERFFQAINPAFRLSVLPQPRWLTGNFVEPYFVRLPVEGSGVTNVVGLGLDLRATTKIVGHMERSPDPRVRRAAEELRAQQIGQGLFIGGRGAGVRRQLEELGKVGQAGAVLRDLPVIKQTVHLLAYAPKSFFGANRVIESGAQRAGFGRLARRDIKAITGSWWQTVRLGSKALEELANGLTDTATQRRFMRAQHAMLGQYEGFPPALRRLTQSIMPFIPWYLNAARFVFWTMPVHHTGLTALLEQTNKMFEQDWKQVHADVPPGGLKYAIPTAKGGWVDLARYTPYGAFTEPIGGGSWQSLTDQIAPQFGGALAALQGKDPFGRDLQVPKDDAHPQGRPTSGELLAIFGNQLAGAFIPGYSTTQRLREGGGTPYATSTPFSPKTKPGSAHMSAFRRTFDPFRPTYLKQPGGAPTALAPLAGEGGDRLTELRRAAAARQRQAQGSSDRLMELRRAAAARARR